MTVTLDTFSNARPAYLVDGSSGAALAAPVASNDLRSATGTKANVASSASSVTVLASNAARKGATIYNDSTAILYLDLSGGTASSSSYSVQVAASGYYEVPYGYSGAISGTWASANGNARVTEFA